jgi:hypothetical protein
MNPWPHKRMKLSTATGDGLWKSITEEREKNVKSLKFTNDGNASWWN